MDVTGLGRPKGFTGKEEGFQELSKKTEAFFAGVTMEFEMGGRGVLKLEFALQQMHTADVAHTSREAIDIFASSRKNLFRCLAKTA